MNPNDSGPDSLRNDIAQAAAGDTIVFTPGLSGQTIALTSGELALSRDLTIAGPGAANLTISGSHASRVFHIGSGATVTLSGLTLADGNAVGTGAPGAADGGGGILNEAGASLTLDHSALTDNHATAASAMVDVFGGGLLNKGDATITASTFTGNQAQGGGGSSFFGGSAGGAIDNFGGATLTVTDSTFTGNQALGADGPGNFGMGGALENNAGFNQTAPSTASVGNCTFTSNRAGGGMGATGNGGALDNQGTGATVLLSDSTFRGNQSVGATGGGEGRGGGILNVFGSTLTIRGSLFADNVASGGTGAGGAFNPNADGGGFGGGIDNEVGATLTITASTLTGNQAVGGDDSTAGDNPNASGGVGGGIANGVGGSATVTVTDCTLADNLARGGSSGAAVGGNGEGGGIVQGAGMLTLTDSTLRDNQAVPGTGGGGFPDGAGLGGGIDLAGTGSASVTNSTLGGNSAAGGGGIHNAGILTLTSSTVSGNTARGAAAGGGIRNDGTLNLVNSIVAGNTGAGGPDASGTFVSQGYNLIGSPTGASGFPAIGDQVGTAANPLDPRLGPLQDNGGLTQTLALLPGSPAIDTGDPSALTATDQRGVARPQDGDSNGSAVSDIGAYEAFTLTPALLPASDGGLPGDGITDVNRPTFTGTAVPGTTVTLLEGSTVLGSAAADNVTGAWSITSTILGEGTHSIAASAKDATGYAGVSSTALPVVIDTQAPTSTIAFPAGATYDASNWTGSLRGGSSDATSGVQAVAASVEQVSTGLFWTGKGSNFTSPTEVFVPAAGTTSWSLAFPASNFPSGGSYRVHVQATDVAGNVEAGPTVSFVDNPSIPPPPPPPPSPPAPVAPGIRAQLATVKVHKRRKLVVQVFDASTGALERQFDAPFQTPRFKGIKVSVQPSTGWIVVSARVGKKSFARTFPG